MMRVTATLSFALLAAFCAACGSSDNSANSVGDDGGTSGNDATSSSDGATLGDDGASGGDGAAADGGGTTSGDASSSDGSSTDAATGSCAAGFHVGSGGYCVSANGVPQFDHVYLVLMENHSLSSIQNGNAPYINGTLLAKYAYATNYTTSNHPSLPNYIDLTSGGTQGIACDCGPGSPDTCNLGNCNLLSSSCNCGGQTAKHIGDQMDAAGIQWRAYAESMGQPCDTNGQAHFAPRHVPFFYYDDVASNSTVCKDRIVDYSTFAADLAAGTYRYSFLTPNLCDDMHDTCAPTNDAIKQGDDWLSANMPSLIGALKDTDALFIVWDEQDAGLVTEIPLIVVSPVAKKGPTAKAYTHESLLATIEEGFGITPKLGGAATAALITDIWK